MADKLRVKTDGAEETAASLLQALGPPGGFCRNGESVLILSPARYALLLRQWIGDGVGRKGKVPDRLLGCKYAVDEKLAEEEIHWTTPEEPTCPSCGGERCRTYRIAATKGWQRRAPLAADLEGKYHDECDDCGYQSEIRSEP